MHLLAAVVTALTLPLGASFDAVQPAGPALLVSGVPLRGSGCVWVTVDAGSLAAHRSRGSCVRPPLAAHVVVPAVTWSRRSPWQPVRIAHLGARVSYGPVVMRYEDASDTRPQWTYGAGWLWLYDVATERGPELLRLSARTGRLEQRVAMPRLFRPVLAADDDGVYLMAAVNGGAGNGAQALYQVTPEARHARVVRREGRAALWLAAHAHTVWVEIVSGTSHAALWRFDGARARATLLRRTTIASAPSVTYGRGSLWAVTPVWFGRYSAQCARETVSRIDPSSGRETPVATVPATGFCSLLLDPQGLTFAGGALFFLDGPRLYRVRPG